MLIYKAINEIMKSVPSISKYRKNEQQGYNFRGIDDIYNALNEHLAMSGVFVTSEVLSHEREERETQRGGILIYSILHVRFTFYATDGSFIQSTMIGEGMDSGDKSSNKAMSTAYKYAFMQLFCIPTEDPKDSEIDSHEVKPKTVNYDYKPSKSYNDNESQGKSTSVERPWLNATNKDGSLNELGLKVVDRILMEPDATWDQLRQYYRISKDTERMLNKHVNNTL
jgi:hypothetical protein